MEKNSKTFVKVAKRCTVMGVVIELIEDIFTVGNDEQKETTEAPIRNVIEGVLIDIVEQRSPDIILMGIVDKLGKSTCFLNSLKWRLKDW